LSPSLYPTLQPGNVHTAELTSKIKRSRLSSPDRQAIVNNVAMRLQFLCERYHHIACESRHSSGEKSTRSAVQQTQPVPRIDELLPRLWKPASALNSGERPTRRATQGVFTGTPQQLTVVFHGLMRRFTAPALHS
jgi:hypothetical protein